MQNLTLHLYIYKKIVMPNHKFFFYKNSNLLQKVLMTMNNQLAQDYQKKL